MHKIILVVFMLFGIFSEGANAQMSKVIDVKSPERLTLCSTLENAYQYAEKFPIQPEPSTDNKDELRRAVSVYKDSLDELKHAFPSLPETYIMFEALDRTKPHARYTSGANLKDQCILGRLESDAVVCNTVIFVLSAISDQRGNLSMDRVLYNFGSTLRTQGISNQKDVQAWAARAYEVYSSSIAAEDILQRWKPVCGKISPY